MGIVTDLVYIVLAALAGGILAHLLRQPLIFGYILAGVIVGPHTGGFTVERIHDIEMLAEIGVALLLFTLGLEFSFGELKRFARITLLGTPLQMALCVGFGFALSRVVGLSFSDSLWIGAAISLSSTMVVLKTLTARSALESDAGRLMLGMLIAQDLAVIPLVLVLPQLSGDEINYELLVHAAGKSIAFLLSMYFAGTRFFPWAFARVARWGSQELFFLSTLAVALGTGFLSHYLGLSFALGAFVAGMLLSETDFNHQALSDIVHLRDLFALIFFVSVGMLFDPRFLLNNAMTVALLLSAIIVAKAAITAFVVRLFGYSWQLASTVGFGLSQVGEFAFVIVNTGSRSGALSQYSYSLMIATTVLSMIVTPAVFSAGALMARSPARNRLTDEDREGETSVNHLEDHLVIIGGGAVGQFVAHTLGTLRIPYVILEHDYRRVTRLRDRGLNVIFGDASRHEVLLSARVREAKILLIAIRNDELLPRIASAARKVSSSVPVVMRVEDYEGVRSLANDDLFSYVHPQLSTGLEFVREALVVFQRSDLDIERTLEALRRRGPSSLYEETLP